MKIKVYVVPLSFKHFVNSYAEYKTVSAYSYRKYPECLEIEIDVDNLEISHLHGNQIGDLSFNREK